MFSELCERIRRGCPAKTIHASSFQSPADLRRAVESNDGPKLVVAAVDQLSDILSWLDNSRDDVCLDNVPQALIELRLQKLSMQTTSVRDALTGLLSRQSFERALELSQTACESEPLSLILCDIDHFKQLNDTYGHGFGDEILSGIARQLSELCGENDLVARYGGEEFAILCGRDEDSAMGLAQKVVTGVRNRFAKNPAVTISLGVATAPPAADLFSHADEALYAAKARGRDRHIAFSELQFASQKSGEDTRLVGLENRARVLSERVANFITLRSRSLVKRAQAEADIDGLTQFYTRRYLDRRLAYESESHAQLTVALVDLDHFGLVNKTHGWPSGDKILREVCSLIRQGIRNTDWVGRYGGEEFCVVMPDTSMATGMEVLERLRASVQQATFLSTDNQLVPMTLSIGAVECLDRCTHEELLERASAQALRAKRDGRNRICAEC